MQSLRNAMGIDIEDFLVLIDRYKNGTPPGSGWGIYEDVVCPTCAYSWLGVALVGTKGLQCPSCGHYDPEFIWDLPRGENNDGAFLNPVGWREARINHN